jgi:type IV secretory pathway VirB10-like protein
VSKVGRRNVADFFLNEEHVYSKKRTINLKTVGIVFGVLVVLVFVLGAVFDGQSKRERLATEAKKDLKDQTTAAEIAPHSGSKPETDRYLTLSSMPDRRGGGGRSFSSRQRNASQIIKRGENSADALPVGSVFQVQLLGKVESTDNNSPVQAVVLDDVLSPLQALVIPKGTRVIGNGQLDATRERLQVRFHTLVFPEGEQFSISGLAAMMDGSSGLTGDFSSGTFRRHASQLVGTFVGGLAQGLKDRKANGGLGLPMEEGSVKNGLLNGVTQSAESYAKAEAENIGSGGASIRVPAGKRFVLFLEQEFHQ